LKLLLDTRVWLWWNAEPERLAKVARRQIGDARNEVFLSAASVWEMAIKRRLGKLPLPEPLGSYVARRLTADDVKALPVSVDHAAAVETLELLHRDPFDRLLIVQARYEGLRLFTVDDQVLAYGSPAVDVRSDSSRSP
jgi:PIN domain nuclease of toxin-antitoxin system